MQTKLRTVWQVENLSDEGFVCGSDFDTKAEAEAYRNECRKDGLDVITFREVAADSIH